MSNNRDEFIKSLKRIGALGTAGAIGLSFAACGEGEKNNVQETPKKPSQAIVQSEESIEEKVTNAENDFLKRYLEAYNKQYGTDYKPYESELVTNSLSDGVVFNVNGKLVTIGGNYTSVKQELSKYGTVTTEDGHDKVMQVLIDRDGKTIVLGTYDSSTLEAMYSGTQLDSFDQELAELEDLGISKELAEAISELSRAKGAEDEKSIEKRLEKCKNATELADRGYYIEFE